MTIRSPGRLGAARDAGGARDRRRAGARLRPWPFPAASSARRARATRPGRGREWDPDVPRTAAMIAGAARRARGAVAWRAGRWRRGWAIALCAVVAALLVVPAVLLQVGLRDSTAPWYHVNDSTYQIEIAGDLVLDGENPYGHDYRGHRARTLVPRGAAKAAAGRSRSTTSRTSRAPCSRPPRGARCRPRSTTTGCSCCSPRSRCLRPRCSSRPARMAARARRGARGESARDQGGVVRDGRRAERPLPRSRVCARDALSLGLGRGVARLSRCC